MQWARELGRCLALVDRNGVLSNSPTRQRPGEEWEFFQRRQLAIPLRNRRQARHMDQTELGELVGVSRDTIQRWELVRVPPRPIAHVVWAQANGFILTLGRVDAQGRIDVPSPRVRHQATNGSNDPPARPYVRRTRQKAKTAPVTPGLPSPGREAQPPLPLDGGQPLHVIQAFVAAVGVEHGLADHDVLSRALLLGEEAGHLAKAIHQRQMHLTIDPESRVGKVDEELADMLLVMCSIANHYGVDLGEALRKRKADSEPYL